MKYIVYINFLVILFLSCAENDGSFKNTSNLPDLTPVTTAQYSVVFNSNWTSTNFPTDYPAAATFSSTILMMHDNKVSLFISGETASAGIASMATSGDNTLLEDELNVYQTAGNATWYDMGVQNPSSPNSAFPLTVSSKQPMVSLCMKMIPSPNWFLSLTDYSLLQADGTWTPYATVTLVAYDNDGSTKTDTTYTSTYTANPTGVVTQISPTALVPATAGTVIGSVTFTKL